MKYAILRKNKNNQKQKSNGASIKTRDNETCRDFEHTRTSTKTRAENGSHIRTFSGISEASHAMTMHRAESSCIYEVFCRAS